MRQIITNADSSPSKKKGKPALSKRALVIIAAVLFTGGLAFLVLALLLGIQSAETLRWQETRGIITGSRLHSEYRAKSISNYAVQVLYSYDVDGNRFEGNQYSTSSTALTGASPNAKTAWYEYHNSAVYKPYQKGSTVKVYYDPASPKNSVLKPGITWVVWYLTAAGAVLVIAASWEWRKSRRIDQRA